MLKSDPFYVTTSIAYVNAAPHIGFAMECVQADALARYYRLKDSPVYFLTGTDEHGSKMYQAAKDKGITPLKLADQNAERFKALEGVLNLSNDDFIRTSSDRHKRGARKLWDKMMEAGDFYKDSYEGYYCVGCENFITEKDLQEGKCPIHKSEPQLLKEENYFFRLSKYSKIIGEKIESGELNVLPGFRKNEILAVIKEGLKDVSFSRPKKVLGWGIEVPNDPEQVMYVWCDALSNYMTALDFENEGEVFKQFWPYAHHLIGKDIIRFHAGIWIGMLLSAKLPLPKAVYVHGFITSEGQKISKSLGNVVDPFEIQAKYGTDALRYYLLREIPTCDDGDFSLHRFVTLYNSDLANNIGNLLSRVVSMVLKYFGEDLSVEKISDSLEGKFVEIQKRYMKEMENFDLKRAVEAVLEGVDFANAYVEQQKPWELAKIDQDKLKTVLYNLLESLRRISVMLSPFIPEAAAKMRESLGCAGLESFAEIKTWEGNTFKVKKPEALFPRLED